MNPATLETIKALAGVANAERIEHYNRALANKMLDQLLNMIQKDVNIAVARSLDIVTAQA